MLIDPAGTLSTLRKLGVGVVRMQVQWQLLAPDPTSAVRPAGFDAADPAAYPPRTWRPYDRLVTDARAEEIGVDLLITGGAPRWAIGSGSPSVPESLHWKPSPSEYGQFMRALAKRYSGTYRPCASCAPLPAVRFWEIWNEPNYGQDLAPQALVGSSVPTSPTLYRGLLDAGWSALQATGHGHDTIIMGSLSPRGFKGPVTRAFPQGLPGYFSTTKPLPFLRTLYCVDSDYRRLRASAATAVGCPATPRGLQQFPARHPALFRASGFGIHPYPFDLPPTHVDSDDPDYAEFAHRLLERITRHPISFEVFADDEAEMRRQAHLIAGWGPNVYVKIPVTTPTGESMAPLVRELSESGVQVNVTALMTTQQVEVVAGALRDGAPSYVSVFAGRIADAGIDPMPIMGRAVEILEATAPLSELIWASPREVLNVVQADAVGCHIITMTNELLPKLRTLGKDLEMFSLETVQMFHEDAASAGFRI